MSWPPEQERADHVEWMLQIQYKPGGWWSNHTGDLFSREQADALLAERRRLNPKCRYRLLRLTTTYVVELEAPSEASRAARGDLGGPEKPPQRPSAGLAASTGKRVPWSGRQAAQAPLKGFDSAS